MAACTGAEGKGERVGRRREGKGQVRSDLQAAVIIGHELLQQARLRGSLQVGVTDEAAVAALPHQVSARGVPGGVPYHLILTLHTPLPTWTCIARQRQGRGLPAASP